MNQIIKHFLFWNLYNAFFKEHVKKSPVFTNDNIHKVLSTGSNTVHFEIKEIIFLPCLPLCHLHKLLGMVLFLQISWPERKQLEEMENRMAYYSNEIYITDIYCYHRHTVIMCDRGWSNKPRIPELPQDTLE